VNGIDDAEDEALAAEMLGVFGAVVSEQIEHQIADLKVQADELARLSGVNVLRGHDMRFVPGHALHPKAARAAASLLGVDCTGGDVRFRPTSQQAMGWFACGGHRERRVHGSELLDAWRQAETPR